MVASAITGLLLETLLFVIIGAVFYLWIRRKSRQTEGQNEENLG